MAIKLQREAKPSGEELASAELDVTSWDSHGITEIQNFASGLALGELTLDVDSCSSGKALCGTSASTRA